MTQVPTINKTIDFKELRKYNDSKIEIRAADPNSTVMSKIIEGYAVKYNMASEVMSDYWGDKFIEEFARGAFDESLRSQTQKCLWNHKSEYPLGSIRANTLMIQSDEVGLYYEDDVPDNSWGNDALESIRRGDVDGSSFLFRALDDQWSLIVIDDEEIYKRTILKADLYEISPTTFPAYPDSEVNARSFRESGGKEVNLKLVTIDKSEQRRRLLLKTYL